MAQQPLRGLTAPERDRMIVKLRNKGWTFRQIARYLGMTPGGVHNALERIKDGRQGRDPRG